MRGAVSIGSLRPSPPAPLPRSGGEGRKKPDTPGRTLYQLPTRPEGADVRVADRRCESLGLKEVFRDYNTLAEIAQARGDARAAAEWARKRDDLRAELQRRAGGGGLSGPMEKALAQLALACARAGFGGGDLDPGAEEALATLDGSPAPFPDFAAHLRQLAAGRLAPIPASLPGELRQILERLAQAIREAQGGGNP